MKGTTLPRMSSDGTPGYPAPDTACIVDTTTARRSNSRRGASARASTTVEQFGFVTIAPGQPRCARCSGTSRRCSALTSGTSSGTSGSMRKLRALLRTMWPAAAKACSTSPATLASSAEKTTAGPRPGTHASTVSSAAASGSGSASRHGAALR